MDLQEIRKESVKRSEMLLV